MTSPLVQLSRFRFLMLQLSLFLLVFTLSFLATMRMFHRVVVVEVPDVVGKTVEGARSVLRVKRLQLDITEFTFDQRLLANQIVSQEPSAGTKVKSGRAVLVKVSRGAKALYVPSVIGTSLREAGISLEKYGLHPGRLTQIFSSLAAKNMVLDQWPKADSWAAHGSRVDLLISQGPRPVRWVMPDLRGSVLETAAKAVQIMGLELQTISYRVVTEGPAGLVLEQVPPAGAPAEAGEMVKLRVSSLPGTRQISGRYLPIKYHVPAADSPVRIKIQVRDDTGLREIYNSMERPDSNLSVPVTLYGDKSVVTIFLNGRIVEEQKP